jgi:hypothetical protein
LIETSTGEVTVKSGEDPEDATESMDGGKLLAPYAEIPTGQPYTS